MDQVAAGTGEERAQMKRQAIARVLLGIEDARENAALFLSLEEIRDIRSKREHGISHITAELERETRVAMVPMLTEMLG